MSCITNEIVLQGNTSSLIEGKFQLETTLATTVSVNLTTSDIASYKSK